MGSKQHRLDAVEGDMTPMIDVVFQLIIFFMTTIRFKELEGKFETQLPKDVGPNSRSIDANLLKVDVGLHADPSMRDGFFVTLNGARVPGLATLCARLTEMKRLSPELKATLLPGRGINYSHVVMVIDECVKARMQDITFAGVAFDS